MRDKLKIEDFELYKEGKESYSQLKQDLLVSWILNEKTNGYFVEFGATDGVYLSNTYLFEKNYGWNGILCEPARVYHEALRNNRTSIIDTNCVYNNTGSKIEFLETEMDGLSTILSYSNDDSHATFRAKGYTYEAETITLDDLLDKYDAPQVIDYLSLDTEGSELDILLSYSFSRHINVITVEHNHTFRRELIHKLLEEKGFTRIFESTSDFDDWYVNNNVRLDS